MAIVFRLPASAAERVAFSYSLVMEAVLSLHVLVEPKHHPVQHEWVRAMRRLSPALKREIEAFAFAYRGYFPEFFFPSPVGEMLDFEGELRRLQDIGERLLRLEFAIPLLGTQAGVVNRRDPAALEAPGTRPRPPQWSHPARRAQRGDSVMKDSWSITMLISGALFAAGVVPVAWERAPAWRAADPAAFRAGFAYTLRRMDRLQPALLLACLAATIGFAVTAHGTARTLATFAAACFAAILVGSTAGLARPAPAHQSKSGPVSH